jgi:hypothetical protein
VREGMQLEARFADACHPRVASEWRRAPAVRFTRGRQAPFFRVKSGPVLCSTDEHAVLSHKTRQLASLVRRLP